MDIQFAQIQDLKVDPKNSRTRDQSAIDAIKKSLEKFGQQKPIVVSQDMTIIAGNGTFEAARQLGWQELFVAITDLSDLEAVEFSIADNRTSELSTWDQDALINSLQELYDGGSEMNATGFDEDEIAALLGMDEEPESEEPSSSPSVTPEKALQEPDEQREITMTVTGFINVEQAEQAAVELERDYAHIRVKVRA